jgi:hypothetical protein
MAAARYQNLAYVLMAITDEPPKVTGEIFYEDWSKTHLKIL